MLNGFPLVKLHDEVLIDCDNVSGFGNGLNDRKYIDTSADRKAAAGSASRFEVIRDRRWLMEARKTHSRVKVKKHEFAKTNSHDSEQIAGSASTNTHTI